MAQPKGNVVQGRGFLTKQNDVQPHLAMIAYSYMFVRDKPYYEFSFHLYNRTYQWHAAVGYDRGHETFDDGVRKLTLIKENIEAWLEVAGTAKLWDTYAERNPVEVKKNKVDLNRYCSPSTGYITTYFNTSTDVEESPHKAFLELGSCNSSFRFLMQEDDIAVLKGLVKALSKALIKLRAFKAII